MTNIQKNSPSKIVGYVPED